MFLFGKKEMNADAAKRFWAWFEENEAWLIATMNGPNAMEAVSAVDPLLCPVFPYEKPERIQFQMGANGGVNEFFFFHQGRKALARDGERLAQMMPAGLKARWKFILER